MKRQTSFFFPLYFFILIAFFVSLPINAHTLPSRSELVLQLEQIKKNDMPSQQGDIGFLEESIQLLDNITQQENENKQLQQLIATAPATLNEINRHITQLKKAIFNPQDFSHFSLSQLRSELNSVQNKLQSTQNELSILNTKLVAQRATPDRSQKILSNNLLRTQNIEKNLFSSHISSRQKQRLQIELSLIKQQNAYNQMRLQGDSQLLSLYSALLEENQLRQRRLQLDQSHLQELINQKKLAETLQQAEQLRLAQQKDQNISPFVLEQQEINVKLSQELIRQTAKLNGLSQDNLRIKSVLNNLQQTQRNINEQISALQGTLVLSRIINKQKHLLPQDKLVNGLAKEIGVLRVKIFDLAELRDNLQNPEQFLEKLKTADGLPLSNEEKQSLLPILQERYRLVSDEIELLNNQLNLAINIELNQRQVIAIGDALQSKLQQQSFWVKSNPVMDLNWFIHFLPKAKLEWQSLRPIFAFSQWKTYIIPSFLMSLVLSVVAFLILWQQKSIKSRLKRINSYINTLKRDRQRYTPEALFWTFIICLPESCLLLASIILCSAFCFVNPIAVWGWGVEMAFFWLYFRFMLHLSLPDTQSIGYRHFGLNKINLNCFTDVLKSSMVMSYLWINASLFTQLDGGINDDVIGQLLCLFILAFSLFYSAPKIHKAIRLYRKNTDIDSSMLSILFKGLNTIAFLAPIGLIILVIFGYYYTALNLMHHLIISYVIFGLWTVFKDGIYRAMIVFSRQLSYRRLIEKQSKQLEEIHFNYSTADDEDSLIQSSKTEDEVMAISKIKDQVLKVVDIGLFLILMLALYWVWRDLVTVAYYLESITLWQTTTATGMKPITLWNLLVAIGIIGTTYALIRNLPGVLEFSLFSRIKFSQGTPYTIITLSNYLLIALGATASFATLGISWEKLQWLFAALSVGLGFGLQEIFANFVSGLIILFERPVRIGDVITIDNFNGIVSQIRIRSTTLLDFDRKEIIVPNKTFVTERIVNWALSSSIIRVKVYIGVAYGSDIDLVKKLLLEIADECPYALKDPKPYVYFLHFGASTLDHELRIYVNDVRYRNKSIDFINHRINTVFAEHNIEIAFNQLDVFIKNTQNNDEIKIGSYDLSPNAPKNVQVFPESEA